MEKTKEKSMNENLEGLDILAGGVKIILEACNRLEAKVDGLSKDAESFTRLNRRVSYLERIERERKLIESFSEEEEEGGLEERVIPSGRLERSLNGNTLWLSRHAPTKEQWIELQKRWGAKVIWADDGEHIELGSFNLSTDRDVKIYCDQLSRLVKKYNVKIIAGVFPPPVIPFVLGMEGVIILSGWNVLNEQSSRFKPIYTHKRFVQLNPGA